MKRALPNRLLRKSMCKDGLLFYAQAAFIAGGIGMAFAQTDITSVERGRDLANLLCSKCHALSASGESPNSDAPPFRDLLQKLTFEGIEDELAEGILLGHRPMPQWEFNGQQIYDLSNFITSIGE